MGYRNAATIESAVRSVIDQVSPEPFEVVVVTSGGDDSGAIVRARFPDLRLVESPTRLLPGGARNAGVAATDAELVAFLAADCIALPGWVERRIHHHRRGHRAVASAIVAGPGDDRTGHAAAFLLFPGRLPGHPEGRANHSQSFSLSYDRSLLDELGPFDAALRIGEDSLMVARITKLGETPWFDPAIRTAHPGPSTLRALLRDQYRRGRLRFAWEALSSPPGRAQRWLDAARSPVELALLAGGLSARGLSRRARFTARSSVAGADDRRRLASCAPLIGMGVVANQLGWGVSCYRSVQAHRGARPPGAGPLQRWVSTSGERVVALTFDDGPDDSTPAVLDELARLGVVATFFVVGDRVAGREDVLRRMVADGHVVGTHGMHHRPFTELDDVALDAGLATAATELGAVLGQPVALLRPPGGRYDARVIAAAAGAGLTTWLWTIDPEDWSGGDAGAIATAVLAKLAPGAVVLLHDGGGDRTPTIGALDALVRGATARGFRFVTLPQLRPASSAV